MPTCFQWPVSILSFLVAFSGCIWLQQCIFNSQGKKLTWEPQIKVAYTNMYNRFYRSYLSPFVLSKTLWQRYYLYSTHGYTDTQNLCNLLKVAQLMSRTALLKPILTQSLCILFTVFLLLLAVKLENLTSKNNQFYLSHLNVETWHANE